MTKIMSAQPICPWFTRILAPGSVPADFTASPVKPWYMVSAVKPGFTPAACWVNIGSGGQDKEPK